MMSNKKEKHPYYTINFLLGISIFVKHKLLISKNFFKCLSILSFSALIFPLQLVNVIYFKIRLRKYRLESDPIFIIGHWRSGTSFLHHLLAQDAQWGIVTGFNAFFPNFEIFNSNKLKRIFHKLMLKKRPQDDMPRSLIVPEEEEFALTNISKYGVYHSLWLPNEDDYFKKYCLMDNISDDEIKKWGKVYFKLIKKYTYINNNKTLLLKNPPNTARLAVLKKLFPNAKYIHIKRNPIIVYHSMVNMYKKAIKPQFLQKFSDKQIREKTVNWYCSLMDKYFTQLHLIDKENIIELKYEDLVQNPMQQLENIYKHLNLKGFNNVKSSFEKYLDSVKNYQTNTYEMNKKDNQFFIKKAKNLFEKLGY